MSRARTSRLGKLGKVVAVFLATIVLLYVAIPFTLLAGGGGSQLLAVVFLIWVVWVTLIVSGADGREEAQRIVERPFDEREHAIRTQGLAIGLGTVVLLNLAWVVYGIAGGHDAFLPALTILLAGASILIAVEVLRRRGIGPAVHDEFSDEPLEEEYADEQELDRPTWIAITTAWLLATGASSLVSTFFTYVPQRFGMPAAVLIPGGNEYLGARGPGADGALTLFIVATSAIGAFAFCLVASRWLNRSVSFAWIFALQLGSFALGYVVFPNGGLPGLLIFAAVSLVVLRYLATGAAGARGLAPRMRLTRPLLIATLAGMLFSLTLACAFATTHPLSVDLITGSPPHPKHGRAPLVPRRRTAEPGQPYGLQLKHNSFAILNFIADNRGVTDLSDVRIVGVESDPAGAARIQRIQPIRDDYAAYQRGTTGEGLTRSLPSGHDQWMRLRIGLDCTGPGRREVAMTGFKYEYTAWGREWHATVPMDKLIVSCPS